jgi:hypothetical protein
LDILGDLALMPLGLVNIPRINDWFLGMLFGNEDVSMMLHLLPIVPSKLHGTALLVILVLSRPTADNIIELILLWLILVLLIRIHLVEIIWKLALMGLVLLLVALVNLHDMGVSHLLRLSMQVMDSIKLLIEELRIVEDLEIFLNIFCALRNEEIVLGEDGLAVPLLYHEFSACIQVKDGIKDPLKSLVGDVFLHGNQEIIDLFLAFGEVLVEIHIQLE